MRKISRSTFLYKRVLPVFFLGFPLVFLAAPLLAGQRGTPLFFSAVPLIIMVFAYLFFRRMVWDLSDKVFDNGDELIFRRGGEEQRVSLRDIVNISHSRMGTPERVDVLVRREGPLGKELAFIPPGRVLPFSRSPLVRELIERVDRARNSA